MEDLEEAAKEGWIGGWEEIAEVEDDGEAGYFEKHALDKLDDESRKELELMGLDCRAKTIEEIVIKTVSAGDENKPRRDSEESEDSGIDGVFNDHDSESDNERKGTLGHSSK